MSFSLDCTAYFPTLSQLTLYYEKAVSSEIVLRVNNFATTIFSNFSQMLAKPETNEMNVKTGAFLGSIVIIIIIATAVIRMGRRSNHSLG